MSATILATIKAYMLQEVAARKAARPLQQVEEAAAAALKAAQPEIMRGVSKGVLHKNTVARKISRLNHRVKTLGVAAAV